jgi:hypothetical protein
MNIRNKIILTVALIIIALNTHIYNGLNKGVVIGTPTYSIGLEVVGDPGVFVCNADC